METHVDWKDIIDVIRVLVLAGICVTCAYLYFDDRARTIQRHATWPRAVWRQWVWLAIGVKNGAVLVLLAMNLQQWVDWLENRWILTPTTTLAFLALALYARAIYVERKDAIRFSLERAEPTEEVAA